MRLKYFLVLFTIILLLLFVMADEADVILNKTSDQVDNILNKWGIPSWTAPEVHHYKFTKVKKEEKKIHQGRSNT